MASEQHKSYRTATAPSVPFISHHARIPISDKYSYWNCNVQLPLCSHRQHANTHSTARTQDVTTVGLITGRRTAVTTDIGTVRPSGGLEAGHKRKSFARTGKRTQLIWTQRVPCWGTCWTTRRCSGRRLPAFATIPIAILLNTAAICHSETCTHIYKAIWRHNVFNKRSDRGSGMHGAWGPANDLRARVHSVVFQQNWRTAE